MADPKTTKARRPKSVLDRDKYMAELTSGQLVIGICILIVFGLACFMLGVLVGKFEPAREIVAASPRIETPPASSKPPSRTDDEGTRRKDRDTAPPPSTLKQTRQTPARKKPDESPKEGTQVSPRPLALSQPTSKGAIRTGPAAVTLPAPPPPRSAPPAARQAKKSKDSKAVEKPLQKKAGGEGPPKIVASAGQSLVPASQPPLASESTAYFVQIGAYKEKRNAEAARRKIEADSPFTGYTVESPGGTLVILRVGGYKSRAEALEASRHMKDLGFSDCFIKSER